MMKLVLSALFLAAIGHGETVFTVDFTKRAQTIENIGSSTGMHGDYISKHWKTETVDEIADLLFSREKGIGLSCFRIQIGGGAEGVKSGIRKPFRRTDCFLRPDGSYDWNNERGVLYWRKKAAEYEIPTVIGYLNSPPVYFTQNGYGFKTDKIFSSNLKPEHYGNYAEFVATVAEHFQTLELPFDYICPVNEPQWDWYGIPGKAKQEGTPWTNDQIARVVRLIDADFREKQVKTKLLIPEAAEYQALYERMPDRYYADATDQVRAFWSRNSPQYLGNLRSLETVVAGHAYFSDGSINKIIGTRHLVKKAIGDVSSNLRFWQTEYCLLGDGWRCELPSASVDEMMAALLLARNIHADFTLANASAWQWWSSTEPKMGKVPRYCLIECDPEGKESYRATKLLWALGHYSRFIRPGMVRLEMESDLSTNQSLSEIMGSAYYDSDQDRWVLVLINFTAQAQDVRFQARAFPRSEGGGKSVGFLTDAAANMKRFDVRNGRITMPQHSIVTVVSGLRQADRQPKH
jgi:O-glycosyl hydrolase